MRRICWPASLRGQGFGALADTRQVKSRFDPALLQQGEQVDALGHIGNGADFDLVSRRDHQGQITDADVAENQ